MRRRCGLVQWTILEQSLCDFSARVIKYPAANDDAAKHGFALRPQANQQAETDANRFPPAVAQTEHSERGKCQPKSDSLIEIWNAPHAHQRCCQVGIGAAGANSAPRDRFNDEIVRKKHRRVGPAAMFVGKSRGSLNPGNCTAHIVRSDLAIQDQIARKTSAKVRHMAETADVIWKNADGNFANVVDVAGIN